MNDRARKAEMLIKQATAGIALLAFVLITLAVLGTDGPIKMKVVYIVTNSSFTIACLMIVAWFAAKVIKTYEEIDSG